MWGAGGGPGEPRLAVKAVEHPLMWHDFQAEAASDDYGSEWDASAGYKFGTRYEVLAKYANYMADGFATDTTKFWIQLSAAF